MSTQDYGTIDNDNDIHIVPVNDKHGHIYSVFCPCKPKLEILNGVRIYTHTAYDHRELFEGLEEWWRNEFYG